MSLLLDESLQKIEFLFKYAGIYLDQTVENTVEHIIRFRSLYIINFLWLNTDVIGEMLWIIEGALNGKTLIELTYIAPCATLCMVANLKSLFIIVNEDNIIHLLKHLRDIENNSNVAKDKDIIIVAKEKRFLKIVIGTLNFLNAFTVMAFCLSPVLLMGLEYKRSGRIKLMLPFLIVYPFDPYNIKYWPFVYLHQIWSACVVILEVGGADCFFYICCSCIHTQFRLLQHDMEAIIPECPLDGNVLNESIRNLVVRHQEIMRSVVLLETIYTKSTLFNFVSSSFLICLTGFNVTAIDDIAFVLSFLAFLVMSLLQIFLLCFFGDIIMNSSMEVGNAIYNSKWYMVNAKRAQQLFVVQKRAQKPCKLTASSYADVNLRAFTKILSTAWSYFALLKTVYTSPRV